MNKKYLFTDKDLENFKDKVKIKILLEDEYSLKNKLLKTEDDYEKLLHKYGKKFFLTLINDNNEEFYIRSYKHIAEINTYFLTSKPGFSKKGYALISNCLLNYCPKKEDILKLEEIDIEFLLTEGTWEERVQLLFHLDYYK